MGGVLGEVSGFYVSVFVEPFHVSCFGGFD